MTLLAFNWSSLAANVGQFILAFSILVILHELGHSAGAFVTGGNSLGYTLTEDSTHIYACTKGGSAWMTLFGGNSKLMRADIGDVRGVCCSAFCLPLNSMFYVRHAMPDTHFYNPNT